MTCSFSARSTTRVSLPRGRTAKQALPLHTTTVRSGIQSKPVAGFGGPARSPARLAGLDQEAGGVRDEGPFGLDPPVQRAQLRQVLLHSETGHHPDHLAQEVHDSADVEEFG